MARKPLAFVLALLISLNVLVPVSMSWADGGVIQDWTEKGIQTEDWQRTADGQYYGEFPSTGPENPYIYKYVVACSAQHRLEATSCTDGLAQCKEAKGGMLVDWYYSLKPPSPLVWVLQARATCIYSEKPRDVLAEIAAVIGREFQQSPVAPASLGSQPGPHTLRGQETNVYANATEQEFNITLLGQKVHITATPVAYTWNYGDGTIWGPTPSPGAPLPEDRIGEQTKTSHIYTITGKYAINLTTHFNGSYSVNGGPALPIPEQGHFPSPPLGLTVWRAITRNYADDCNTNPHGVGC
ncbi:MAG: hypothetical protein WBX27_03610 [Specibacter sp.]